MKSSLPQIFAKDIYQLSLPQKQSQQFSLFIRNNSFTLKNSLTSRYNNGSSQRTNKSMDGFLSERKRSITTKSFQNTQGLKSLLTTQLIKAHSKSYFIEQTNRSSGQQIGSFKSIRNRSMQELILQQKSLEVIKKQQKQIKQSYNKIKANHLQELFSLEEQLKSAINALRSNFKQMKKQCKSETKVNKQQTAYLQEQTLHIKQILEGFQHQSDKLTHVLLSAVSPST